MPETETSPCEPVEVTLRLTPAALHFMKYMVGSGHFEDASHVAEVSLRHFQDHIDFVMKWIELHETARQDDDEPPRWLS